MNLREVDGWYERVTPVTGASFISVYIDELLPEPFARDPLETSIAAFESLAHRVEAARSTEVALLVVSCPPTRQFRRNPPSVPSRTSLRLSPPVLYVCGPSLWCSWGDDEEYRVPVQPSWFSASRGRVRFRVHRDEQGRRNGWEFERSFYIHSGGTV